VEPKTATAAPADTTAAAAAKPTPSPAAAPGTWAVQVVALSNRAAADAVVRRLVGKGYQAFLVAPQAGAPVQSYKVQVGRFSDRAEAEKMKLRLKRDEQFEPIVLR
jgi:rare lipoprotein A